MCAWRWVECRCVRGGGWNVGVCVGVCVGVGVYVC